MIIETEKRTVFGVEMPTPLIVGSAAETEECEKRAIWVRRCDLGMSQ